MREYEHNLIIVCKDQGLIEDLETLDRAVHKLFPSAGSMDASQGEIVWSVCETEDYLTPMYVLSKEYPDFSFILYITSYSGKKFAAEKMQFINGVDISLSETVF